MNSFTTIHEMFWLFIYVLIEDKRIQFPEFCMIMQPMYKTVDETKAELQAAFTVPYLISSPIFFRCLNDMT